MKWKASLFVVALLIPGAAAHHYSPIQPGALLGSPCTMNFVFTDDEGELYIGAAGHCVPGVGERVIAPGLGGFGTTVFWRHDSTNFTQPGNATGPLMDFALIRVDADKRQLVDPAMRFWGGPTGVETAFAPGTPLLHYGQGLFWQATEPSRPRHGVLQDEYDSGPFTDWFLASHAIMGGDSGSALLTANGKGLGIISTVAVTWGAQPGVIGGPTLALILQELEKAGFAVQLVTSPFAPLDQVSGWQERLAMLSVHCQAQPASDPAQPDGCVRQQYYSYHVVDAVNNSTSWSLYPWGAMANSDPKMCPEAPWYPTLLEHPCRTEILILDQTMDHWSGRTGGLRVTMQWTDSEQDVDLYVFDAQGRQLAASTNRTGNAEQLFVDRPEPGQYRIVAVPVRYVETDIETMQYGDPNFTVTASLEAHPHDSSDTDATGSKEATHVSFLAVLSMVGLAIGRRRRPAFDSPTTSR